jgi:hypothetical protein
MISVAAAALIAGTGFAGAQQPGAGRDAPSGSSVQQSAPSSERAAPSAAPTSRDSATESKGSEKGMKATQSDDKMAPQGGKSQRAQDDMKAGTGAKGEKSAQDNMKGAPGKDMKAEGRDSSQKGMNAETKGATDSKSQTTTQSQTNQKGMNAETKGAADSKSSTTTGNAATSATSAPPAEKRTQIVSAIRSEKIQETTNVNFNISVGTRVPASVHFVPLPPRIVEIYPEWRGYEVILVSGRYIIVRPQTHEIVYIIEG